MAIYIYTYIQLCIYICIQTTKYIYIYIYIHIKYYVNIYIHDKLILYHQQYLVAEIYQSSGPLLKQQILTGGTGACRCKTVARLLARSHHNSM